MGAKVLAALVADVLEHGQARQLTPAETDKFHREFESKVSSSIEQMRADKRRAYEEVRNITIS